MLYPTELRGHAGFGPERWSVAGAAGDRPVRAFGRGAGCGTRGAGGCCGLRPRLAFAFRYLNLGRRPKPSLRPAPAPRARSPCQGDSCTRAPAIPPGGVGLSFWRGRRRRPRRGSAARSRSPGGGLGCGASPAWAFLSIGSRWGAPRRLNPTLRCAQRSVSAPALSANRSPFDSRRSPRSPATGGRPPRPTPDSPHPPQAILNRSERMRLGLTPRSRRARSAAFIIGSGPQM